MGVTVEELLDVPFYSRREEEKRNIVKEGKPRPLFYFSVAVVRQSSNELLRIYNFDQSLYDVLPWLTRCDKRRSFFCWPCLLFKTGNEWSTAGIPDSEFVIKMEIAYNHERSSAHIQAMLDWHMFIKNYVEPMEVQLKNRRIHHIATLKKNRGVLKRLIDVVCNTVTRIQPLRGKGYNQLKKKDCIFVLEMLRKYDIQSVDLVDEAILLLNTYPKFLHDLVDAVTVVMKLAFKKEVQMSTYASVILSEHSETSSRSQISAILRYIKAGKVYERFIGFINMTRSKSVLEILQTFKNIVSEYDIKERFLAQSVDGQVAHANNVRDLIHMLKAEYPNSYFAPYYSHGLNYILQQSVSHIEQCGMFFKVLKEVGNYFQKSNNHCKEFQRFMCCKLPTLQDTNWFKRSQLINVLHTHRKYFTEYFEIVEQNELLGAEELAKIYEFKRYFEHFDTLFLLHLFNRLFEIASFENSLVRSGTPERAFEQSRIEQLKRNLIQEQETGFVKIWLKTVIESSTENNKCMNTERNVDLYHALFNKIINAVIQEIDYRFTYLQVLEFCHLLDYEKCNLESIYQYIEKMLMTQGSRFDGNEVYVESMVLRSKEIFRKPAHDLLEFFIKADLKPVFPSLFRLAELILTLPIRKVRCGGPSKLKQISSWSYTSEGNPVPGDASILLIEKDFLQELKENANFYEEVFIACNRLSNYVSL